MIDWLLSIARLWLRTPLERATIDAVPAGERLIDAVEAHFATPQGIKDKALLESLGSAVTKAIGPSAATPSNPSPQPSAPVPGKQSPTDLNIWQREHPNG